MRRASTNLWQAIQDTKIYEHRYVLQQLQQELEKWTELNYHNNNNSAVTSLAATAFKHSFRQGLVQFMAELVAREAHPLPRKQAGPVDVPEWQNHPSGDGDVSHRFGSTPVSAVHLELQLGGRRSPPSRPGGAKRSQHSWPSPHTQSGDCGRSGAVEPAAHGFRAAGSVPWLEHLGVQLEQKNRSRTKNLTEVSKHEHNLLKSMHPEQ